MIVNRLQVSECNKYVIYPPYADSQDARGTYYWPTEKVAASGFPTDDYEEFDVETFMLDGIPCTCLAWVSDIM